MKLSDLTKDLPGETRGVWKDYSPGVRLRIAPMGNINFDNKVQQMVRSLGGRRQTIEAEQMMEFNKVAMAETVLLDWEGITDDDDEPIVYTPEVGLRAFNDSHRFFRDVTAMSNSLTDEELSLAEGSEGN